MDLAKDLRAARAAFDQADAALTQARASLGSAGKAYDDQRRHSPAGTQTCAAHTAWALALREWSIALIAREAAKDTLAAERRDTDQAADVALLANPRESS